MLKKLKEKFKGFKVNKIFKKEMAIKVVKRPTLDLYKGYGNPSQTIMVLVPRMLDSVYVECLGKIRHIFEPRIKMINGRIYLMIERDIIPYDNTKYRVYCTMYSEPKEFTFFNKRILVMDKEDSVPVESL